MPPAVSAYRFGPYELRPRARELCKNGVKIKLRPQPYRVLELLVEGCGDVVTRENLKQQLWSSETFVDFEQGLNTAVKELRATLSDSADEPRYVETIPKVGYRIVVPVEAVPFPELTEAAPEPSARNAETTPVAVVAGEAIRHSPFGFRWAAIAGIIAVVLIAASVGWRWSHKRIGPQPTRGRVMLAVLPFENLTGDAGQEYFSDGLTEEMISQLGRIDPERLGVIARTSVMTYKQNPKALDEVGRELGVEYVLEGSVRRDANTVRVSAQLIQVNDQTHLWSRQYDRELSNLLSLQAEIALEIADEIQLTLGDKPSPKSTKRRPAIPPVSYEAYDLCLKGRYFLNQRTESGMNRAAEYFQQAVEKAPNYAPAYAGLAQALALLSTWRYVAAKDFVPRARAAALKALEIDDTLAEAHASLALIAEQYDYDWQTAEKEFRRAIQLEPGNPTAHQWFAECLSLEGRFDESLAESARARQLDPLSLIITTDDGVILYYARQYDRAIQELQTVREMRPGFPRSGIIFNAYIEKGDFAAARSQIDEEFRHTLNAAGVFSVETYLYGKWGKRAEAERSFAKFEEESKLHPSEVEMNEVGTRLSAYLGVGRMSDAITALQQCSEDYTNCLIALKVDPIYDPLRGDPRFQALVRRANLAQ